MSSLSAESGVPPVSQLADRPDSADRLDTADTADKLDTADTADKLDTGRTLDAHAQYNAYEHMERVFVMWFSRNLSYPP